MFNLVGLTTVLIFVVGNNPNDRKNSNKPAPNRFYCAFKYKLIQLGRKLCVDYQQFVCM